MKRTLSVLIVLAFLLTSLSAISFAAVDMGMSALILPNGLLEIQARAFAGNTSITTVVVPNTVTQIGSQAFQGCTNLREIAFGSEDIEIAADAFDGCSSNLVFSVHSGSQAELYALSHGKSCMSIEEGSDYYNRLSELLSYSGFDMSILMSDEYASRCLIVRTIAGTKRLPDISDYNPEYIFRSEDDLFYIQFYTDTDTENCFNALLALKNQGQLISSVEVDHAGTTSDSSKNVAIAEWWGSSDPMGFTEYGRYVREHKSGSVTIAIVDSGVSDWGGKSLTKYNYVDRSGNETSSNHANNIAGIISDCVGSNIADIDLISVKVLNSGTVYRTTTLIEGIKTAAKYADIVNMSFGVDEESPEIKHQIDKARQSGVLFVAAAGNGTVGPVLFPARYNGVLAVSALSYDKDNGSYTALSRTGSSISFTAPGMKLATQANPALTSALQTGMASTSYAAPQITAALALIKLDATRKSQDPVETLKKVCNTLNEDGKSAAYGFGLPEVWKLAIVELNSIELYNADGGDIPARMAVGSDFALSWNLIPSNVTDKTITVTSSDSSVLGVRQTANLSALITAKKVGSATITVTSGNISKTIDIVVEQPMTELHITGASGLMYMGKTMQLGFTYAPANATNKNVIWRMRTIDTAIATVDENGLITAIGEGEVRIIIEAADGHGANDFVDIEVKRVPNPTDIKLGIVEYAVQNKTLEMAVGDVLTLEVELFPEDALQEYTLNAYPAAGTVEITSNGVMRALAPGNVTVVATAVNDPTKTDYLSVIVPVPVTNVTLTPAQNPIDISETVQITAEVSPSNATYRTLTWSSNNNGVATVDGSGLVTAVSHGTVVITATAHNGKKSSVTLTVRKPIKIAFNANGGTAVTPIDTYAETAIGPLPTTSRTDYTFDGWYNQIFGGTLVTESSTFTESTTLIAHWTGVPYAVTFDANGGSCNMSSKTARVGQSLGELPTPTRGGYTFKGWFTAAEEGNRIDATYVKPNSGNLTLYAQWINNPYTVTYNANGGVCEVSEMTSEVDKPIGTLPCPSRQYYTFEGWYTAASGGDYIGKESTDYSQPTTATLNLYAHWTPNTYQITFNFNNGTGETSTKTATVDSAIGTLPTCTKPYYTLIGWFTAANSGTEVTSATVKSDDEPLTLYAHWKPDTYTINFNANGGTCNTTTKTGTVDASIGTLPTAVRPSYDFAGWYTAASGGMAVTADFTQDTTASLTLYAHWTPHPYKLFFDINASDGSCSTNAKTYYVGTAIGSTLPVPTRPSHRFEGWFTHATDPNATQITSSYAKNDDSDITVYARWTLLTYTVTFDAGEGRCATTSMTATAGVALGTLPTASRDYFDFNGWYANGIKVSDSYVQTTATPLTLTAGWTIHPEIGWVTESQVPSGAQITQTSWSYTEHIQQTGSALDGWMSEGYVWSQIGTGSQEYANFPSGEFDTNNTYYKNMAHGPYTASETETTKRTVSNTHTGYIYWHWAYNAAYSPTAERIIAYKKGYYGSSNWGFVYFYAIKSTVTCPQAKSSYCTIGQYPSNGRTTYNCASLINDTSIVPASHKTSSSSGLCTWRFYRLEYLTSTYVDYVKMYKFYRNIRNAATDPGTDSNITDKVKYVKYRTK